MFLSARFLSHPILFTGRRLYLGDGLFPWATGYDLTRREATYKRMYRETDRAALIDLLNQNNIAYVAFDDMLRRSDFVKDLNERVFIESFEKVFEDTENVHGNIKIYRVPIGPNAGLDSPASTDAVGAFIGGQGPSKGQFANPRGIDVDSAGNFYVADTMNARIQKFQPDGTFVSVFGSSGPGVGEMREPNDVAVDSAGNIFVVDALNHRLLKFSPDGIFVSEWAGPEATFFGPRSVTIGPDQKVYVLDQGRSRVVRKNAIDDGFIEWGKPGGGEGDFNEPTAIEVADGKVYIADAGNQRIQVFDLDGKFIAAWPISEWTDYPWRYPDIAFDADTKRLYVTSPIDDQILVLSLNGERLAPLRPDSSDALENASALAVSSTKAGKRLLVVNTGKSNLYAFDLGRLSNAEKPNAKPTNK